MEDGEDLEELKDRARDKKERRATNKFLKGAEASNRGTPMSDADTRGRKGKKGKGKATIPDFDTPLGSKRKRGNKSMSVTPSILGDDDDDDRDTVCLLLSVSTTVIY